MLNRRILSVAWLVVWLVFGWLAGLQSAIRTVFNDWPSSSVPVEITMVSPLDHSIQVGDAYPLTVQILNNGLSEVAYTFVFDQQPSYRETAKNQHEVHLRVPPKSTIQHQIRGLSKAENHYSKVRITGSYLEGRVGQLDFMPSGHSTLRVRASIGMEQVVFDDASSQWKKSFEADDKTRSKEYPLQGVDLSLMPENPLWLNHLDRLVVSASTWNALPTEKRQALQAWVFKGGHVILLGEIGPLKDVAFATDPTLAAHGLGKFQRHTAGLDTALSSLLREPVVPFVTGLERESFRKPEKRAGEAFVEERGKSLWIFVGLLPLYALSAGPLMLAKFAPKERRSRIFWMVPALAIVASVLATIFIVVGDGFGGKGKRFSLIYHDSSTQKAILNQIQVSSSGLLLRKDFETPSEVYVTSTNDSVSTLSKEVSNRVRYEGDYFKSRSVDGLFLTHYYSKRGGYQLLGDGHLVSSSADHLKTGFVFKGDSIWKVENLRPGEKGALQPATLLMLHDWSGNHLGASWTDLKKLAAREPGKIFLIAELERTEDLVPTLDSIHWEADSTLYFTQWNQ